MLPKIPPSPMKKPRFSLALITGATGGLGRAFAAACARRGWNLFLTDLDAGALRTLAESLEHTYGVRVLTHACDLTQPAEREALLERAHTERLRFWWLINVAGVEFEGPFADLSPAQLRTMLRLNVEATLELILGLLPLRDRGAGFRVVNVASLAAFQPMPIKATYAASKRFLLDFSLALGEELREFDATVTVVCPAGMPTTAENVAAIEAQGVAGWVTTQSVGAVAEGALEAAWRGQRVFIPGWANRAARWLGALLPPEWLAHWVGAHWKRARRRRKDLPAAV